MFVILKYQQYKNNKCDIIELRGLKCQQLNAYNNKKEKNFDMFENKDEREDIEYIFIFFIIVFLIL